MVFRKPPDNSTAENKIALLTACY